MSDTLTFGKWVRHLTREWKHDGDQDALIAFAIRMATFSPDGGAIYASAPTLAELAGINERTARRRRSECIKLGFFRRTGRYRSVPGRGGKIEELELSIPKPLGQLRP